MCTFKLYALFVTCFSRIHTNGDLHSLHSLQYSILWVMPPPFLFLPHLPYFELSTLSSKTRLVTASIYPETSFPDMLPRRFIQLNLLHMFIL